MDKIKLVVYNEYALVISCPNNPAKFVRWWIG